MTEFARLTREREAPAYLPARSPPVRAERGAGGELHNAAELGFSLGKMSIYPKAQAKLTVGPVNDQYEQEADRIAEQAVSMPEPVSLQRQVEDEDEQLQAKPLAESITSLAQRQVEEEEEEKLQAKPLAEGITPLVQRQESEDEELQMAPDSSCPECEQEDEELQAKPQAESIAPIVQKETDLQPQAKDEDLQAKSLADGITSLAQRQIGEEEEETLQAKPLVQRAGLEGMEAGPELEQSINQSKGSGMQLADGVRSRMEGAFGVDFGSVRIHSDANADRLNRSIQARAFTTGQDIFLRQGEYRPGSSEGERLLAHELTHVVQQNKAVVRKHTPELKTGDIYQDEKIQRDIENATYNDPIDENKKVALEFFSAYDNAAKEAYKFATSVPSLDPISSLNGHTTLWVQKWMEYLAGGRPKLMAATFGYVIESLVSDQMSYLCPKIKNGEYSVDTQVTSGGTRPDLVLRLKKGSNHIAWLDLTASNSANHIFSKEGWERKVKIFAEVTYPSLDPAVLAFMKSNKDNKGTLSTEAFEKAKAEAANEYRIRKEMWTDFGKRIFLKSTPQDEDILALDENHKLPNRLAVETDEGILRNFIQRRLRNYFNEPITETMVPSILRAMNVDSKAWGYSTGYSESEKAGEAWLIDQGM